jgi:type I restriction enzyme M protein
VDNFPEKVSFIWSVADLLRGDYKQSEYGRVILPLVVLRRLDCVLEPTKAKVLAEHVKLTGRVDNVGPILEKITGHKELYNASKFDLLKLLDDPNHVADNLRAYIAAFSPVARDVMHRFGFDVQIDRLDRSKLLYLVVSRFCDIDLHPDVVSNTEMGYIYEELIRRFSEQSNETAGEHFTPREVIRLMVNLLFVGEEDVLAKPGIVKTLFDPACGTGGMLSVGEDWLRELNPKAQLRVFGQELNDETYATCRADMMLKGQDAASIHAGNSFTEDGLAGQTFDYMLANPPFGVEWKKVADEVRREHETRGFSGRFGAGLPRINDGSLLFLQHMLSKMKPVAQGGSRLAIVFNGSPLFTGAAGSGESEIRRWIIENDWLEAVVALPDQLFYNTGISTYFWVLTNRKSPQRRGKVQLVDAREYWTKMRKSLGEKRKQISDDQIGEITQLYASFTDGERSKIFPNEAFGYQRITVERPLRARWEVTDETLAALAVAKPIAKVDDDQRAKLADALTRSADLIACDAAGARAAIAEVLSGLGMNGKATVSAVVDALMVRDEDGALVTDAKGNPLPDSDLRDQESVPLPPSTNAFEADIEERLASGRYRKAIEDYVEADVLPFAPDAWIDHTKTKIGYEIPLTRHFYTYVPPRPLEEIDAEIKALETEIQELLREVTE